VLMDEAVSALANAPSGKVAQRRREAEIRGE
jgi:hypothetical protein